MRPALVHGTGIKNMYNYVLGALYWLIQLAVLAQYLLRAPLLRNSIMGEKELVLCTNKIYRYYNIN